MISVILLIVALLNPAVARSSAHVDEWDYVKIVQLPASELGRCQSLCEASERCWEWELQRAAATPGGTDQTHRDGTSNINRLNNTSHNISVDCFLQSREFVLIKKSLPSSVMTPRSQSHIAGRKQLSSHTGTARAQVQALVAGPMAIDTSTLLNFPQHFVSQCAYTVSVWVWIWRPRGADRAERIVLSSKEVHPRLSAHHAILPAIVYNVGDKPDAFFFAAAQGQAQRDYLGFHRGRVRYHQWVHLAITMENNAMSAYQDGEFLDSLQYAPAEIFPADKCVYDTNVEVTVSTAAAAPDAPATLQRRSSGAAFFETIITDPFAAHVNNTVLYVGSQAQGRGLHSTVGMVHQLVVVRNQAYSATQVAQLSERTRPPISPSLQRLLRAHGIPSLEGICPAPAPSSFYAAVDWGLCPEEVCGRQCIDENIFLGEGKVTEYTNPPDKKPDLRAETARRLGLDARRVADAGDDSSGKPKSSPKSAAAEGLPAIGRALGADGIYDAEGDHTAGFDPFELVLGSSLLQVLLPVLAQFNLGWLALLLGLQTSVPEITGFTEATGRSGIPAREERPTARPPRSKRAKQKTTSSREDQAQRLYSAAMERSADRLPTKRAGDDDDAASANEESTSLDSANAAIAEDFTSWRARGDEEARAALMLGMWLAEDASAGKVDLRDQPWNFKETPLLAQPMHLSLGYRAGYGAVSDNFIPFDEVDALLSTTNDSFLVALMDSHTGTSSEQLSSPYANKEGDGQFYIASDDQEPAGEAVVQAINPSGDKLHEKYQFTLNERGEVTILEAPDVIVGKEAVRVGRRGAQPKSWLKVFANLTTDTVKAALLTDLAELVAAGLNASFVHSLIMDRQLGRQDHHDQREQLGQSLDQASGERTAVALESHHKKPDKQGLDVRSVPDCTAAAAYYFPVTQYVAAQFGASHSGTGPLEEVRLIVSGGPPEGHGGEEDELHQHTEAEAHDGNPDAQTWLAKKYFWGLGGVDRNEFAARRWFERAAAQNDPEGLYNVGIFHNNGQAGLPQNEGLAMQYFHRAADHPLNPFPLAMNVVGNHYLHSPEKQNYTRAMDYFLKAAALHSDDAHFSLAMIYREGLGCAKDVPRSVAHLALAASWGHVRALNFLAHALHDADSWLAQYGREQHALRRHRAMLAVLLETPTHGEGLNATGSALTLGAQNSSTNNATAAADALLRNSLVFDEFELIKIYLSNGVVVPLPYPLGSPAGSCEAALPLLKHIAEMSYRPKDVTSHALKRYLKGDYWAALSLYEEAADLGVWAAQENAAYIIEKIAPAECAQMAEDFTGGDVDLDSQTALWTNGADAPIPAKCTTAAECCTRYLERRASHRWAQLSGVGEPRAMRKMAGALQGFLRDPAAPPAGQQDSTHWSTELALFAGNETHLSKQQQAAVLFALAGEQGDTESMLNLGWMLYYGSNGIVQNVSAATELFKAAMEMEADLGDDALAAIQSPPPPLASLTARELAAEQESALLRHQHARRWHPAGFASRSTAGAAPALALAVARADDFLRSVGINATTRDIQLAMQDTAERLLPSWAREWVMAPGQARDGPKGSPDSRNDKSWWVSLRHWWARTVRTWSGWLGRLEELNLELYSATWETLLLIVVVALSRLALIRQFRR